VGWEKTGISRSTRALSGATFNPLGGTGCGIVETGVTLGSVAPAVGAAVAGATDGGGVLTPAVARLVGVGVLAHAAATSATTEKSATVDEVRRLGGRPVMTILLRVVVR
jgi:hypothetical protein